MSTARFRPSNTCALCKRSWTHPDPKRLFPYVMVDHDGEKGPGPSSICDDCWEKQPADIVKRADFPGIRKWFRSSRSE